MWDALHRIALRAGYRALIVWWWLRRPTLHGAYVAVWYDDQLLLVRNSYKEGETLPCGGLQRGESHRTAALRELGEEVGIHVDPDRLQFVCEIESQGRLARDRVHFFELLLESEPAIRIDGREVVWAGFCPSNELPRRPLIRVVRTYLLRRSDSVSP